ncbi:MAG: BMP family ABC transporter substrate-binding protein [Lachnospiraceae bacterium]
MKKKIVCISMILFLLLQLTGCSLIQNTNPEPKTEYKDEGTYELALISSFSSIDGRSFNIEAWNGIMQYAGEHSLSHKEYRPKEKTEQACTDAIQQAVRNGAKVILVQGYLFEVPIYKAQIKYPKVKFVFFDGQPRNSERRYVINKNVCCVHFAEEQAGYLAGYIAIAEGYRQIGFIGGIAIPSIIRYGYGFVQGADAAVKDKKIEKEAINIKYSYTGNFNASSKNRKLASSWYDKGTQVIFACGQGVEKVVLDAAKLAEKKVIGSAVDRCEESDLVIISAIKNTKQVVYKVLSSYYEGTFQGGSSICADARIDGIQLTMTTSRLKRFTMEEYETLYASLSSGFVRVGKEDAAFDITKLKVKHVAVEYVK